jgi:bifunctional DNase/RNase
LTSAPEPALDQDEPALEQEEPQEEQQDEQHEDRHNEHQEDPPEEDGHEQQDENEELPRERPPGFAVSPEKTCVMSISTIDVMLPDVNPVLTLQEMDSPFRQLRIPIGQAEGIAIAYARRQIRTPRPLSHELFAQIMEMNGLLIEVVRITDVQGSSFSGDMIIAGPNGQQAIPCRVSDAIALSLRQKLRPPIVATEDVLSRAGGA